MADENDPIRYESFTYGAKFASEVIEDMRRPRPKPPLWQLIWFERWRMRHAWDALVHGTCDNY